MGKRRHGRLYLKPDTEIIIDTFALSINRRCFSKVKDGEKGITTSSDYQMEIDYREKQMENKEILELYFNKRGTGKLFQIVKIWSEMSIKGIPNGFNGNVLLLERIK